MCKRIGRRLQTLHLPDPLAYRRYLEDHPEEWLIVDSFCRISVSRLMRDQAVFAALGQVVLPALAAAAARRGDHRLSCWSAGCASGEEPYTLNLLWKLEVASRFPALSFAVLATDVDAQLLARARAARYGRSSLREVPPGWIAAAFERGDGAYTLRPAFRAGVEFLAQDIRRDIPPGPFDLILCRNMAFTYFAEPLQQQTLGRVLTVLRPDGALVIGLHEHLPARSPESVDLEPWIGELGIHRRLGRRQLDLESAASPAACD